MLSIAGGYFAQRWSYQREFELHRLQVREQVYAEISGYAEELENVFLAYATASVNFFQAKLGQEKLGHPISGSELSKLEAQMYSLSREKARMRQNLLQTFGKLRLYFQISASMQELMNKVESAKNVKVLAFIPLSPTKCKIELQTPEGKSEFMPLDQLYERIRTLASNHYSEPVYALERKLRKQLQSRCVGCIAEE